ncbi:multi-sensor hybrid histidine kinase : Multi-sensor hybrid histidine kinase OS=Nitrosospira multiformis (strain ATCC 25196 / NCIMB 11849) GN=Nmul_A2207 PE=4 SV=1: Response_reg: PAS_9: PAS: PAS_3: PAS_3: PAS_3: PAS_4: PAS_9: GAF: HisKA: HATPase_c: Response_reg [Gemmata massiliana]|uniref:histidine kinase n=1 Tax=Gemmata massiliana TaxID=1210884 RepID=A0A6P2CV75_9BACT|nr:PAS domain S-box protein [Gemmata massiliana]VTR92859.1 multi-sensor hybrid histidine kinase : Multi-sensor hybrid histidine kinase OS=Nitrosospira multiformis (strain ATCC 25196 / NCIMB 11849) GN=Nmul_A2207 PE=4 SV=1: Response_reg: PAS_9: PAS: PAS_3: PAS_3: PAS_3: PAS_4: PAS_9: GAF: HisKA: HATPase_c: Response_reg [Gemmata massiliana]
MNNSAPVNILLVDDQPERLRTLETVLGDLGQRLVRARSGEEAIQRALETDFAVILLGAQVPGSSGFEVAERVRARGRHTPIIFLNHDTSIDFPVEKAYALGAVDHLTAPLVPVVLRSKVSVLIELARRTCEAQHQQLWRTTLASIGDGVIATDAIGRVTFLNPVAEQLTKWPTADARGRPLTEVFRIVNETTRKEVENPALRALGTGTIVGLANHTILIARDGTEHPIDDSAAPIRWEDGTVDGAVLVFRDITERKLAEVARARLAAIVESSDDAIVGKDLDGTIRSWNRGAERVFGYTAAEAVGRSITLVVPPDRFDEERTILERLGRGERIEHFETQRVRKDGRRVDVALTISPIRDAEGHITGASKIARDVTTAKRVERARVSALQAGEVGTYHWDIRADRVTGDRNFAALFGVTADEHASAPVGDFLAAVHSGDRERVGAEIRHTLDTDAPFRSEYRVTGPGGERWLLARGAVERAAGGEAVGWAGVVVDITDRKRAEGALATSRARLDYAVQASGIGFWYCDLPFDVLQWDERVKAHFWLPPEARVTIDTFYDRIHPDDRGPTRAAIERSVAERTGYDVHYRTVNPETRAEKWVRAIGGTYYDETGAPKRFDGVTLDVTDQRRAEAALRESNDRFAIVARATNDAVWDWDMRTNAVWWNEGVGALFGYRSGDVGPDATWWYEHIHPEDRDRVVTGIHAVIDHGGANWSDEYRFRRADGTHAAVLDRGHAIHEDGKTVRLVGAMQDITERRRAEERLRESEQRFRSLFESMDEGYCVVEPVLDGIGRAVDYRYLLVNPALETHTGLRNVVGKTAREVMPTHESHWIEAYARVAETGEPVRRTDRVADLDRWYDVSAFRVGPPGGRQVGVLFNDITDRKRAEARLREKDERLQLLVDRARDYAMVVTDRDGRVVEWTGGAESITGFAPADVLGKPADVLFTPEDQSAGAPAREMEQAAREGRAEDQRWHARKDGSQFFADGVMVPLRGDDGALHGFGKVFRDVTARKRAEEAVQFLADASASLAELVDYQSTLNRIANLAVAGFADWCVVDMIGENGARERLAVTASESEDVSAARGADVAFRPHDGATGVVPHVLRTGEPEVVPDLVETDPTTAPQGPERLAKLRELGVRSYLCVPLASRGRVIGGMTFLSSSPRRRFGPDELRVAQNLAERVTVAIENAQLYRTLQEQDRRKDEFLATLAHELRNPLAPVRNGVQILRLGGVTGEAAARALTMMDRQLGHMAHLIDDLMDVARVSSGKVVLRKEQVPLRSVVDAAAETSRQAVEAGGHELALRMPAEPLTLNVDRTRLVQVLANLLNNAAKYTLPGGRIVLSARRGGDDAVIQVADTGVGIPAEMLPKVFEMFAQVGTSLERSQGGLGIGLTLVKRLVEMHGGSVRAESPGPGRGSTFTVRLPLAPALVDAPVVAQAVGANTAGRPLDVLVVDDNRDAADSMAMLLEIRGHRARTAHDGPEALKLLATFRPQLVLLDLGLPGMSGYEVARRIRESTELQGLTLAALTGWGQEEDRRRTREAGFDHHLTKPADPGELDRIVAGVQARG